MAITASILGRNSLDLGPANLSVKALFIASVETNWADESDWIDMGLTESSTLRLITSKTDLNASQEGTRPADKVVTAQQVQIETNLGEPFLERLELVQQGLVVEKDTPGVVEQWMIVKRLGQRDSDVEFWARLIKVEDGVQSTDINNIVYIRAAAMNDNVELVFDAASQRFYGVLFEAYLNDKGSFSVAAADGAFAYAWGGDATP